MYKDNPKKLEKYLLNKELKVKQILKLDKKEYFVCSKEDKKIKFSNNINFNQLIHWIRSWKFLSSNIINKIDEVRNIRNTIHINLYKENLVDFTNADNILRNTVEIIKAISKKLA